MNTYRTQMTIGEINEMYEDESFEMNPDWQRDHVWSTDDRSTLISCIRHEGFPIPEMCFWKRPDGALVVVDGKQRCTSIFDFIADNICYKDADGEKVWFSGLEEDEKTDFLSTMFSALVFGPENTEDDVISYYKVRNSSSKALVAGELLRADSKKPLVVGTLSTFEGLSQTMIDAFGKKPKAKRSGDLKNSVPFLASYPGVGGMGNFTTSYRGLRAIVEKTTQETIDEVLPEFKKTLRKFIDTAGNVVNEDNTLDLREKWKGFPPAGKVAAMWFSVVDPNLINGEDPSKFWSVFYQKLRASAAHSGSWDRLTRKNTKTAVITEQLTFAKNVVHDTPVA
jgi:uncharacterized protein YuzB (UPF0349 family)